MKRKRDSTDMRILNITQPSAYHIVTGSKDVENRSHPISKYIKGVTLPVTVLVLASKAHPTRAHLASFPVALTKEEVSGLAFGASIGTMEIVSCARDSSSPWYHPGDYAWKIGKVVKFDSPIMNVAGSQTPCRKLSSHPDRERIESALKRIKAED